MTRPIALLLGIALGIAPTLAQPASYPSKPITLVVPFAPGGATDVLARDIGQQVAERLKQPIIIDNKPGAGTTIGTTFVARAPADGYTLLFAPTPFGISQVIYSKPGYDALRDFVPVTLLLEAPFVLVANPSLPANTVAELIALAKAKPGSLSFASAGNGTVPHLAGELFKLRAGIDMVHVPYKGGGPAIIDLLAGQTQLMFAVPVEVHQQIAAGKLKVIATTAPERLAAYPKAQTLRENGLQSAEVRSWFGVMAPAHTPPAIARRLAEEFAKAVESPALAARLAGQGVKVNIKTGEDFSKFIAADIERWREAAKASNAKID